MSGVLERLHLARRYDHFIDRLVFCWSAVLFGAFLILAVATSLYVEVIKLKSASEPQVLFGLAVTAGSAIFLLNIRFEFDLLHLADGTNMINRIVLIGLGVAWNITLTYLLWEQFRVSR